MAVPYNIEINQGETYNEGFQWVLNDVPFNLIGYTGACQIRSSVRDPNVLATVTVTITDAINGRFELDLTAEQTSNIPIGGDSYRDKIQYVYDVKFTSPLGEVYRAMHGFVYISPEATK